jgi:hypothetical protein
MRLLKVRLVLGTLLPQDITICQNLGRPEVVAFYSPVVEWAKELKGLKEGDFIWILNQWANAKAVREWLKVADKSQWVALFMMRQEWREVDANGNKLPPVFFPSLYVEQPGENGRIIPSCCTLRHSSIGRGERMAGRMSFRQWTDEQALGVLLGRFHRAEYRTFLESCGQRPMVKEVSEAEPLEGQAVG